MEKNQARKDARKDVWQRITVRVHYTLDAPGRLAALAAGLPAQERQYLDWTTDGVVESVDAAGLADAWMVGNGFHAARAVDGPALFNRWDTPTPVLASPPSSVSDVLDAAEEQDGVTRARLAAFLALPIGDTLRRSGAGWAPESVPYGVGWNAPGLAEWRAAADAEIDRRHREEEVAREAKRARTLAEATDWIPAHGSPRLRLAAEAGLVAESLGVYRDERLAVEWPGWAFDVDDDDEILNPPEIALSALLRERAAHPGAGITLRVEQRDPDCDTLILILVSRWDGRRIVCPAK